MKLVKISLYYIVFIYLINYPISINTYNIYVVNNQLFRKVLSHLNPSA